MSEAVIVTLIVLGVANLALLILVLLTRPKNSSAGLKGMTAAVEAGQARIESAVKDEIARNREESSAGAKDTRQELIAAMRTLGDSNASRIAEIGEGHKNQLDSFARQLANLTEVTERRLETMRTTIEAKLTALQEDNSRKLDQMRAVVDEKLQTTLEKRLGESFSMVAERLERVHKGLGEMQSLASGVGDLKRVLMNIRTRGTWAEVQLNSLLEQVLAVDQYEKDVVTRKGATERVEFAIRLPGRDGPGGTPVLLPIDAKFPREVYDRLVDATEQADPDLISDAVQQLERTVKKMARDIQSKYLDPPNTTDFGIMYLPTEGLYAEVIRRHGLCDVLQREFRVAVTGPSTIWAFLTSLQMGFKTLAIQKRTSEVWNMLGSVKTDFVSFGVLLDKTKKKLQEASNVIDDATKRSRRIERRLDEVQSVPFAEAAMDLAGTAGMPLQELLPQSVGSSERDGEAEAPDDDSTPLVSSKSATGQG